MRIKICGITRVEDALIAADAGADAVGLVFYDESPRCVSVSQAQEIVSALPPFVSVVALFVNPAADDVIEVLAQLPIDMLQFHGNEAAAFCAQFQRPYLKAIRVKPEMDVKSAVMSFETARGIVLDTFSKEAYGGTGHRFDWSLIPGDVRQSLVLSGGLDADAVKQVPINSPVVVLDVSSGVEQQPGIKCAIKVKAFCDAVRVRFL